MKLHVPGTVRSLSVDYRLEAGWRPGIVSCPDQRQGANIGLGTRLAREGLGLRQNSGMVLIDNGVSHSRHTYTHTHTLTHTHTHTHTHTLTHTHTHTYTHTHTTYTHTHVYTHAHAHTQNTHARTIHTRTHTHTHTHTPSFSPDMASLLC